MIAILLAGAAGAAAGAAAGELLAARAARRPVGGRGDRLLRLARRLGGRLAPRMPLPRDAAERLDAAGLSPDLRPADLQAIRGAAAVVAGASWLVVVPLAGAAGVLLSIALPAAIALAPEAIIARRIRLRSTEMLTTLPDAIDLLRIALGGGRSVPEALAAVGAHHQGTLAAELQRAAAEVRVGVPVQPTLEQLRRRCPADGAIELTALLARAHRQGAAADDGLRALAEDLRERRARQAIDAAARAAPKVQLVVALLLVPSVMLLIAAALLAVQR